MRQTIWILLALLLAGCSQDTQPEIYVFKGRAQGTTMQVNYVATEELDIEDEVADLLNQFDESLSLWRESSLIKKVNQSEDSLVPIPVEDRYFVPVFDASIKIRQITNGAFDPTVYPLVKAWGFGAVSPLSDSIPDVTRIMQEHHIGERCHIAEAGPRRMISRPTGMQFDYNGIAQGYSVDLLAQLIEEKGIENYMVEIGGELFAQGLRPDGGAWRVGVETPESTVEKPEFQQAIELRGKAIATSGSYRKFQERDGKRYSHCIDPRTGYPVEHSLLSVTVIASDCMHADAYATAFMVMGVEETMKKLSGPLGEQLEVLMIYFENGENQVIGTGRFASEALD